MNFSPSYIRKTNDELTKFLILQRHFRIVFLRGKSILLPLLRKMPLRPMPFQLLQLQQPQFQSRQT